MQTIPFELIRDELIEELVEHNEYREMPKGWFIQQSEVIHPFVKGIAVTFATDVALGLANEDDSEVIWHKEGYEPEALLWRSHPYVSIVGKVPLFGVLRVLNQFRIKCNVNVVMYGELGEVAASYTLIHVEQ